MVAASLTASVQAQQKVYLNKGEKNVETVQLAEGDYIAFGRPEGVREQGEVEVASTETGKNYVTYKIETKHADKMYQHMIVSKAFVHLFMASQSLTFDENDEQSLFSVFQTLILAGYGYSSTGTQSFSFVDGEKDGAGNMSYILGGQDYYLVTCGISEDNGNYYLDDDMRLTKLHTKTPGVSNQTLSAKYLGYIDGKARFEVNSGTGVKTLHMVLGTAQSIDEFSNVYGYDYLMTAQSTEFTRDQWEELTADEHAWNVDKESDYTFYVLGVDNNGDWVKAQIENFHIKPAAANDCPTVDVTNYSANDGSVAIEYKVESKASKIKSAKMLLMKENDWDDALNSYKFEKPSDAWPLVVEASKDAVDMTDVVTGMNGKFTYKKNFTDDERGWYVAVLAVTDEYGTTVTRASFHTHLADAKWEVLSHTYPVGSSTSKVMAGGFATIGSPAVAGAPAKGSVKLAR